MDTVAKIGYFEYVLTMLLKWESEVLDTNLNGNDLSVLKSLKLLFFISAVDATEEKSSVLLEKAFDKFCAMPYGPVESEIYDEIRRKSGLLTYYAIDNICTTPVKEYDFPTLDNEIINAIDNSIASLRRINDDLICLPQFELVELSHAWYSWQSAYNRARRNGLRSTAIPIEHIKSEDKIFSLKAF